MGRRRQLTTHIFVVLRFRLKMSGYIHTFTPISYYALQKENFISEL
jgi:hypothetical protein